MAGNTWACVESHADPEVYPRPDGSVYICGEAESVEVPEDPATIRPRASATASLQVSHALPLPHVIFHRPPVI
jgi:hypothetical protein